MNSKTKTTENAISGWERFNEHGSEGISNFSKIQAILILYDSKPISHITLQRECTKLPPNPIRKTINPQIETLRRRPHFCKPRFKVIMILQTA
ncbi:hypothetical protein QVD17_17152 [Tagetes erecta]|uniref:Uncharacterized protein n=1 Tax=Tagetes erecta TaxID=13708 RepID=A0AAD8KTC3_TARER|nr:hypothetical protein QVD17_17152 [Tagetes erecta]